MTNKNIFTLQYNLLRLSKGLIVIILYLLIPISFTSCLNFKRLMMGGGIMIDTPTNNKNDRIIQEKILPYIAKVLDYNDPHGTDDPVEQMQFRRIPTVNNMNYDNVVNCQDYALLFYALCKYYNISCNLVLNATLMHAYNQITEGFGVPVDIEPQSGENRVFVFAMHGYDKTNPLLWKRINTHPDSKVVSIDEWNNSPIASPANMKLLNYVILNGKLPN